MYYLSLTDVFLKKLILREKTQQIRENGFYLTNVYFDHDVGVKYKREKQQNRKILLQS